MSWVVRRGRGSWVWVWVNVVGKKIFPKKMKITKFISKKFKIDETKISPYMPVLFPFPGVSKANIKVNPFVQTGTAIKETLCTM